MDQVVVISAIGDKQHDLQQDSLQEPQSRALFLMIDMLCLDRSAGDDHRGVVVF